MAKTIIHIDGELPLKVLDDKGWAKGSWEDSKGRVCAHQAIRLCAPVKGDAYLIEQIERCTGTHGTDWNDAEETVETDVRGWFKGGLDYTDEDCHRTFGVNWWGVVQVIRQVREATSEQLKSFINDATTAAANAANAATAAANAAAAAANAATATTAAAAANAAAANAVNFRWRIRRYVWGFSTYHLADDATNYTTATRDLLIAPYIKVFGMPEGLIDKATYESTTNKGEQ